MTRDLFLLLPSDPIGTDPDRPWWLVEDGDVVMRGDDSGWIEQAGGDDTSLTGLADVAAARCTPLDEEISANPQAKTIRLIEARSKALGHEPRAFAGETCMAMAEGEKIDSWQRWATGHGAPVDHLVPLAAILPQVEGWHALQVGSDRVLFSEDRAMIDEPGLRAAVVGDAEIAEIGPERLDKMLVAAAGRPPVDMVVRRRRRLAGWRVDRDRLNRLAVALVVLGLLLALMPIVEIIRWNGAAGDMDSRSERVASEALGRPVAVEEAEGALRGERVQGHASAAAMLAALAEAMQADPAVRAGTVAYANGTLSFDLKAPQPQQLQTVIDRLQRQDWRLSAQPSSDDAGGASMRVDMGAV